MVQVCEVSPVVSDSLVIAAHVSITVESHLANWGRDSVAVIALAQRRRGVARSFNSCVL